MKFRVNKNYRVILSVAEFIDKAGFNSRMQKERLMKLAENDNSLKPSELCENLQVVSPSLYNNRGVNLSFNGYFRNALFKFWLKSFRASNFFSDNVQYPCIWVIIIKYFFSENTFLVMLFRGAFFAKGTIYLQRNRITFCF